jgi:hypothetical protein
VIRSGHVLALVHHCELAAPTTFRSTSISKHSTTMTGIRAWGELSHPRKRLRPDIEFYKVATPVPRLGSRFPGSLPLIFIES